MRLDIGEREGEILQWIDESQSKAFICKQLKCRPLTLDNWLKKLNITYAGNQSGKGIKSNRRVSALDYMKSDVVITFKLKQKLLEDGIKEWQCEECALREWLGRPIPLELHHVDGNRFNSKELNNLQLLCPNCHSLTDSYRGKNKNKYKGD